MPRLLDRNGNEWERAAHQLRNVHRRHTGFQLHTRRGEKAATKHLICKYRCDGEERLHWQLISGGNHEFDDDRDAHRARVNSVKEVLAAVTELESVFWQPLCSEACHELLARPQVGAATGVDGAVTCNLEAGGGDGGGGDGNGGGGEGGGGEGGGGSEGGGGEGGGGTGGAADGGVCCT